jgi:hypothetical protein
MAGPIARFKTVAEINELHPPGENAPGEFYKFVRVDGEYRFAQIGFHCPDHRHLVGNSETADAAGMISVYPNRWQLKDRYSKTLELGCGFDDIQDLTELLQREGKDSW